jgi:HEAT repeat protein
MPRPRLLPLLGLALAGCAPGEPPAPHPSTLKLHAAEPWARQLVELRPRTWLKAFLRELDNPDEEVQAVAAFAVAAYGEGAVRELIAILEHGTPRARAAASFCLRSIGVAARPALETLLARDLTDAVRSAAETAYYAVATERAPELVARLAGNPVQRARVQSVLRGMEAASIPILAGALATGDPRVRVEAAALLGDVGATGPQAALAALLTAAQSGAPDTRAWALCSIGRLGQHTGEVEAMLADGLAGDTAEVRAAACAGLGALGSAPPSTLTLLQARVVDADTSVRAAALLALARLPADATTLKQRVTALRDADPAVRLAAIESLRALGEAARGVLPELRSLTGDPVPWVREATALAVAALGG